MWASCAAFSSSRTTCESAIWTRAADVVTGPVAADYWVCLLTWPAVKATQSEIPLRATNCYDVEESFTKRGDQLQNPYWVKTHCLGSRIRSVRGFWSCLATASQSHPMDPTWTVHKCRWRRCTTNVAAHRPVRLRLCRLHVLVGCRWRLEYVWFSYPS